MIQSNRQDFSEKPLQVYATRYLGSKAKLINWIWENTKDLPIESVFDAFSGTSIVGFLYKQKGKQVFSNDFLSFNYYAAKALIENNSITISQPEVEQLLLPNTQSRNFIQREFTNVFFPKEDTLFLDNIYAHMTEMDNYYKKALVMSAVCRAILKKAPYGRFTTTTMTNLGKKTMQEYFLSVIKEYNSCVFDNQKTNVAYNEDTISLIKNIKADAVYFDPPYGGASFTKYEHYYNFIELYCNYWEDEKMVGKLKQIQKRNSIFSYGKKHNEAFVELFNNAKHIPYWIFSYNNNGGMNIEQIINLIGEYKTNVKCIQHNYDYANKLRTYEEYLIIAH